MLDVLRKSDWSFRHVELASRILVHENGITCITCKWLWWKCEWSCWCEGVADLDNVDICKWAMVMSGTISWSKKVDVRAWSMVSSLSIPIVFMFGATESRHRGEHRPFRTVTFRLNSCFVGHPTCLGRGCVSTWEATPLVKFHPRQPRGSWLVKYSEQWIRRNPDQGTGSVALHILLTTLDDRHRHRLVACSNRAPATATEKQAMQTDHVARSMRR